MTNSPALPPRDQSADPPPSECDAPPVREIEVTSASRLHFGLLSWGGSERQFGGVGMMVEQPGVRLRVYAADRFAVAGPHSQRVEAFVRKWYESRGGLTLARVACEVLEAPPEHVGLGLGTQLGLSVGMALSRLVEQSSPSPVELACRMGRGLRSSVGTYGFFQGGLIFEPGKLPDEKIAPSAERYALPDTWRIVLLQPVGTTGEAGEAERRAFASLPPVPDSRTRELLAIVRHRLLPALERSDCLEFGQAIYDYGRLAGECFAAWQGGAFNGSRLTALVDKLRDWGVAGVGQSSWGPTLFAILDTEAAADSLVQRLRAEPDGGQLNLQVTRPANAGARVREISGVRFAHG